MFSTGPGLRFALSKAGGAAGRRQTAQQVGIVTARHCFTATGEISKTIIRARHVALTGLALLGGLGVVRLKQEAICASQYSVALTPEEIDRMLDQYKLTRHVETAMGAVSAAGIIAADIFAISGTGVVGVGGVILLLATYVYSHLEVVHDGVYDEISEPKGRLRFIDTPREMLFLMGLQAQHQYLSDEQILPQDDPLSERLRRCGGLMGDASKLSLPAGQAWEFWVIDDDEKNAFVLPGGKVFVHRGLMEFLNEKGELEVILGHEIAHVQAQHAAERLSLARFPHLLQGIYLLLLFCGVPLILEPTVWQVSMATNLLYTLPFSRLHEEEADRMGLRNMVRACLPPSLALKVWHKMREKSSVRTPAFLSTHPTSDQRYLAIENQLQDVEELYKISCSQKMNQQFKEWHSMTTNPEGTRID